MEDIELIKRLEEISRIIPGTMSGDISTAWKKIAALNGRCIKYKDRITILRAKVAELEDIANDYKQQISDQAIEIDDNQTYMKAQQSLISDQKNAIQALEAKLAKYENLEPACWMTPD